MHSRGLRQGTPVLAACGSVAIEELQVGDLVWAENPETREKGLKEVVRTFVNETTELIYIQVGSEEILTTPEHPFYSPVKGWTAACQLRAGDILVTVNGEYVIVEKIQHEILENPLTVYNFEVEDFHTYYVGNMNVLVHNDCAQKVVARQGGWSAKVPIGGKQDHNPPHAHIYYKNDKLASVTANGKYLAESFGKHGKQGRNFVKKHLDEISEGIRLWWG